MQQYVEQLIEDLEYAAKNPPQNPYIEPPPHLDDDPVISELALVPFKSIEEWTGIKQNVFPNIFRLSDDQINNINEAILKLMNSLNIDLLDIPKDLPVEILYDVIIDHWDAPVQYLPSSGFDLEFCTGDPQTCPFGEFCDCDEELPVEEPQDKINYDVDNELPF